MIKNLLFTTFLFIVFQSNAQFIVVKNKLLTVNGCAIYMNGTNTPWQHWNDFGVNYDATFWAAEFGRLKSSGINSTRIWFSCDGAGQPTISTTGAVTGVSQQFWSNCDDLFKSAQANGIYIMATLMSFDHTKNGNTNTDNWRNMLSTQDNVTSYVNNYLAPFVNRYKTNPYLMSIDICNEIEWIYENGTGRGDGSNWGGSTYAILQRFVAMCAAGIHKNPRTDGTTVLATLGSASMKWNSPAYSDGNKWSDAALKAQFNDTQSFLDFYAPHYYGWMYTYFKSPFDMTVAQYQLTDRPVVIAEMVSVADLPTPKMSILTAFNNMKAGGYQGHFPWTSNLASTSNEIGTLTDFGPSSLAFEKANVSLVYPTCTVTGTKDAEADATILVYPNPSSSTFTIQVADETSSYSISSISGMEMESGMLHGFSEVGQKLAAGTYILKVESNGGNRMLKIVKR